jgi:divalent metal cation (Fe/Co/Zn/Cd) transporter
MQQTNEPYMGPEFPSLGAILVGTALFMTGWALIMSIIGIPIGILMFAVGLGLLTTPKKRS